jgi:hypothetical protein
VSLKAAVEKLGKKDGTSINQFVVVAIAEKVAAMTTEELLPSAMPAPTLRHSTGS